MSLNKINKLNKSGSSYLITTILGVAVVTAVVVYLFTRNNKSSHQRRENMVAEFYNGNPHKGLPTRSYNGQSHYALWVVPGVQPELSSVVRKYGGYHIKLMNMQPINLPSDFSLDKVLLGFPSSVNHRFNLMLQQINVHEVHTKSHLAIMVIDGASTLNLLRKFFQTSKGGSWKPLHFDNSVDIDANKNVDKFNYMTLGSDDPYDQAKLEDFTYQTQWYVQLVKGPNFEWIHTQRVMLYAAQGLEG